MELICELCGRKDFRNKGGLATHKKTCSKQTSTKYVKQSIPKTVRDEVWKKYCGSDKIKGVCYCCGNEIDYMNGWHCGHVQSEKEGGKTILDNLRPLCAKCNTSMGTTNMFEFMNKYGFKIPIDVQKTQPDDTANELINEFIPLYDKLCEYIKPMPHSMAGWFANSLSNCNSTWRNMDIQFAINLFDVGKMNNNDKTVVLEYKNILHADVQKQQAFAQLITNINKSINLDLIVGDSRFGEIWGMQFAQLLILINKLFQSEKKTMVLLKILKSALQSKNVCTLEKIDDLVQALNIHKTDERVIYDQYIGNYKTLYEYVREWILVIL